ncbi:hypothetical protein N7510_007631 [Penicillium lagena]|uniref:uncharacterized protein n=1 Tax=Penicillium lagena TaxID=94218 RepID=UPI00254248BF|nr:uncharacterized protein N7510_007631 [Penicillium lagena]KAJ5610912.1 hypothetical protein N7510_007631 [Penicillium lagena]
MKAIIAVPAVTGLLYRVWARKSLTPLGTVFAAFTATAHAAHPWFAPFVLMAVFYFGGTKATKVKHDVKARLTLSAAGTVGEESPRNHLQVLANSLVGSVLSVAHTVVLAKTVGDAGDCFSLGQRAADVLMVGIVANYAAVAADTFSSELGILAKSKPRLITSLTLRQVPPGTNGGVTAMGLAAGLLGSFSVAGTSALVLPFCAGTTIKDRALWTVAMTTCGVLGSLLDSVLGGLLQASVVDKRSGKIVEGIGGRKVLIHPASIRPCGPLDDAAYFGQASGSAHLRNTETIANAATLHGSHITHTSAGSQPGRTHEEVKESRRIEVGRDWLDNNGVNMLMAATMSFGAMGVAQWVWGVDVRELL